MISVPIQFEEDKSTKSMVLNKISVHIRGQHERSVRRSPWFGLGIYAQLVSAIGYISVQCPRTFIAALNPHLYLEKIIKGSQRVRLVADVVCASGYDTLCVDDNRL